MDRKAIVCWYGDGVGLDIVLLHGVELLIEKWFWYGCGVGAGKIVVWLWCWLRHDVDNGVPVT